MQLTIGIFIIGSLYWDTKGGRTRWRNKRLRVDSEWRVKAPIRYGRRSKAGAFTMVYSRLPDHQLGKAKVVQCRHNISSLTNLITEAEWLWASERRRVPLAYSLLRCLSLTDQSISANWGCVALLKHPDSQAPQQLLDGWAAHVARNYPEDPRPLVDGRGLLQIPWPEILDGTGSVPLDLLLATANNPFPIQPPSVDAIANAWIQSKNDEYFRRNCEHGITTFQDHAIAEILEDSQPASS